MAKINAKLNRYNSWHRQKLLVWIAVKVYKLCIDLCKIRMLIRRQAPTATKHSKQRQHFRNNNDDEGLAKKKRTNATIGSNRGSCQTSRNSNLLRKATRQDKRMQCQRRSPCPCPCPCPCSRHWNSGASLLLAALFSLNNKKTTTNVSHDEFILLICAQCNATLTHDTPQAMAGEATLPPATNNTMLTLEPSQMRGCAWDAPKLNEIWKTVNGHRRDHLEAEK